MMSISLLASQGRAVPCPRRLAPHARASSAQPSGGARRAPWALGIRTGPDAPAKSSARPGRGSLVMCSSSGRLGLKRSDPTADDAAEDYAAPGELTASIAAAPPPPRPRAAGGEVLSVNVSVGTALLALSLTALAGTGAAVASFMVFIRPAVKAMEEASISANKASKEVEKMSLLMQKDMPVTLASMEQASLDISEALPAWEEAGKDTSALVQGVSSTIFGFGKRSEKDKEKERGKDKEKEKDKAGGDGEKGDGAGTGLVEAGGGGWGAGAASTITALGEDVTDLTKAINPMMDAWRARLQNILRLRAEDEERDARSRDSADDDYDARYDDVDEEGEEGEEGVGGAGQGGNKRRGPEFPAGALPLAPAPDAPSRPQGGGRDRIDAGDGMVYGPNRESQGASINFGGVSLDIKQLLSRRDQLVGALEKRREAAGHGAAGGNEMVEKAVREALSAMDVAAEAAVAGGRAEAAVGSARSPEDRAKAEEAVAAAMQAAEDAAKAAGLASGALADALRAAEKAAADAAEMGNDMPRQTR